MIDTSFGVDRIHIPLDGIISAFGRNVYNTVVIITIRRPEQKHLIAGKLLHFFMYSHYFFSALLLGQLGHIFMIVAMISQVMACGENGLHIVGICLYPVPRHEKSYINIMFFQNLQDLFRIFVSPGEWLIAVKQKIL